MTAGRKLTPSEAYEYQRRIDNLDAELGDQNEAVEKEREAYRESLDDDEQDLTWDDDDTDDDKTADRLRSALEKAGQLLANLETGESVEFDKDIARLEDALKIIETDLREWSERRGKRPY